ncbi:MAG: M1 family aminopeptidase [candidate division WOR-3 bacterium]|nr:M1 family aminopeptidase [candidate division WOR-3 bacterium]
MRMNPGILLVTILFFFTFTMLAGESVELTTAEIEVQYNRMRDLSIDESNVIEVNGCLINKDVAEFELKSGHIYFFAPVFDNVVAAYFEGSGNFRLSTDDPIEKQQVLRFTGKEHVDLEFEEALFFFTDDTYEKIRSLQKVTSMSIPDSIQNIIHLFRQKIRGRFPWNFDARVIAEFLNARERHFFGAFLEGMDGDEFLYLIDPMDEEEVTLFRYEKIKFSKRAQVETWYSSRPIIPFPRARPTFDVEQLQMDVEIEGNQRLVVDAKMRFTCLLDQARIMPVYLDEALRVETAILGNHDTCLVIQEEEKEDAQLWIVFPFDLQKGERYDLTLAYGGEGLINDIGGDNFSIGGRIAWFPSVYTNIFDPRHFLITFAVPQKRTLLSTGKLVRTWTEGNLVYSMWDSEIEYMLAGFNYGKFSAVTQQSSLCDITCYTNEKSSDALLIVRRTLEENRDLQAELMLMPQELTTDGIGKNAAIESRNAYEVFHHFFGEIPIRSINISQQPQVSFAASWPALIFLPFTAFFDESVRQRLFEPVIGLRWYGEWESYHEGVASHEMAHQWWAHSVMTASYHDTWLNEGFATYSEALHLLMTKGTDAFKKYMRILRRQVYSDIGGGKSLSELGPVWLGIRLSSFDAPQGYYLTYVKGAYILHMLRMMLFDYDKKNDERFIKMMKDYVRTYTGKVVTTLDFKNIVEKHFDRNMDWFFDQWVYGSDIPVYEFKYEVEETDGEYYVTIYVQQSGVSPSFEMLVPFLVNFEKEHAVVKVIAKGTDVVAKKFHLPRKPVSIEANPLNAVLCVIVE